MYGRMTMGLGLQVRAREAQAGVPPCPFPSVHSLTVTRHPLSGDDTPYPQNLVRKGRVFFEDSWATFGFLRRPISSEGPSRVGIRGLA